MAKLATIERIHSIRPHPNPDVEKLEVAKVKEWPVVIPKATFADGDLVVFIQIDSVVPHTNSYFAFMERQKYRVWNAKFKGAPSQGLVCPLSILDHEPASDRLEGYVLAQEWTQEGFDVTERLGVQKYEKPMDDSIRGDAKGGFPLNLVSITDEDNLLNSPSIVDEYRDEMCYITLKADGSSMTVINDNGTVRVCSRRLEQKEGTGFWKFAEKYDLARKIIDSGKNLALQAEACGGKIQGNALGLTDLKMFVFNVKDVSTGKWFGRDGIMEICREFAIPMVHQVCEPFRFDETWTVARLQEMANKAVYVTSIGQSKPGEGIVLRPCTPKFSPTLGKSLSVKILNQDYK